MIVQVVELTPLDGTVSHKAVDYKADYWTVDQNGYLHIYRDVKKEDVPDDRVAMYAPGQYSRVTIHKD